MLTGMRILVGAAVLAVVVSLTAVVVSLTGVAMPGSAPVSARHRMPANADTDTDGQPDRSHDA